MLYFLWENWIYSVFQNRPMWELLRKFNEIELLESLQIAKYDLICGNYNILLKISKELSPKIF
ncbi:hypothetical protein LEP1GSC105_0298 [Leptospira interrogans str. UI 12758]|uniref:Uncharacterized protein n=2 Tax=Leptospira interrogans TaxID=173 RepID=A0A0E2CYX1_LEPIR|nr:hypothetical protein LEP1GSC105_0298 [Leptospira interrogans str. UI 12758]EMM92950.1 hypothetical protein LEP1GSC158_0260 [Leptospira interrogans serovar Zanoni str. LT2156]